MNKIIEDNIISEQENKIIDIFRNNLAAEKFTEINSNAIYQIISNILSDSKLSNIEKQQIDSALKILPVSANEVDNINKIVVQFNTVIEIQNKGIDFLEQKESFNGKTCLYKNRIVKVVKHIKKGQATFEEDGECNLYIDNDFLHFVSEGHKKISIKQIINTELQDDIVVFTIENRQRPIYLKSSDGLLIISIIASLKTS